MKIDSEFLLKIIDKRGITLSDVSFSTDIELDELKQLFAGSEIRGWQMIRLMRYFNCKTMVMFKTKPSTIHHSTPISTRKNKKY